MSKTRYEEILYQLKGVLKEPFKLRIGSATFRPNKTTDQLTQKVIEDFRRGGWIEKGYTALELGCGTGVISLVMAFYGATCVEAVDIMPEAVADARHNVLRKGLDSIIRVYQSDLYQNVFGKFDIIFADVAAMAEVAAKEWYGDKIPCGGRDGTENIVPALEQAGDYLKEGGRMYFPVVGLSDIKKIHKTARNVAGLENIELVAKKSFPFSNSLKKIIPRLEHAREEGLVNFHKKRSRFLWNLEIMKATKSRDISPFLNS